MKIPEIVCFYDKLRYGWDTFVTVRGSGKIILGYYGPRPFCKDEGEIVRNILDIMANGTGEIDGVHLIVGPPTVGDLRALRFFSLGRWENTDQMMLSTVRCFRCFRIDIIGCNAGTFVLSRQLTVTKSRKYPSAAPTKEQFLSYHEKLVRGYKRSDILTYPCYDFRYSPRRDMIFTPKFPFGAKYLLPLLVDIENEWQNYFTAGT